MARLALALFAFFTALFLSSTACTADSGDSEIEVGTVTVSQFPAAEQQYIDLADAFHKRLEVYWKLSNEFYKERGDKIPREESEKFQAEHDPSPEFLPQFLAFEREHAGQDVGLDALNEVASYAARGGDTKSAAYRARRELLARLPEYRDREMTTMLLRRLTSGPYDPQITTTLRTLANDPEANSVVRATAQLTLADKVLSLRAARAAVDKEIAAIEAGMPTVTADQLAYYREYVASLPPADELEAGATEAITMLETLAASDDSLRQPEYRTIDPTNHLIRIDTEKSKTGKPFATLAAALLFKDRHLRVGQTAPDVDFTLIDGKPWKLADQRGRVVVIQFSFTGCGPCEAMYPGLRKLQEEFGDKVSILTIMRDPTPDTALAKTASGTFTWPITCDGPDFPLTTKWAVDGYPEVYVLNPAGQITAIGSRDEQLHWRVAQLLEEN
jgi:thiol-disulfide isomerase/thioredoxin